MPDVTRAPLSIQAPVSRPGSGGDFGGITRLYLGAQWLTDVLGGSAIRTLWFLLVLATARAVTGRRAQSDASLGIGAA